MSETTIALLVVAGVGLLGLIPAIVAIVINERKKRQPTTIDSAFPPDLSLSWGYIVGLLRTGADPSLIASAITRNDRVKPGWRSDIPVHKEYDYDISLIPYTEGDDPFHGHLDDITVTNVDMFRAEQMDDTQWWVCCYLDSGVDSKYIMWNVFLEGGEIRWTVTDAPPRSEARYKHLMEEE